MRYNLNNIYSENKFRLLILVIYGLGLYGIYNLFVDTSMWWLLVSIISMSIINVFGHTIALHRYFTHKSFNTSPASEIFLAFISILFGGGSPITYAGNHRHHHKVSDQETDSHSPSILGKLYVSTGLWELNSLSWFINKGGVVPRDLIKNETCMFIHNNYMRIWYSLLILTWLIDWKISVYLVALPAFLCHIGTNTTVNCINHLWGYRNFDTNDNSKNSHWLKYIILGEAYHNNHHAHPNLYDFAVMPNESDFAARIIEKFLAVDGPQTQIGKLKIDNGG